MKTLAHFALFLFALSMAVGYPAYLAGYSQGKAYGVEVGQRIERWTGGAEYLKSEEEIASDTAYSWATYEDNNGQRIATQKAALSGDFRTLYFKIGDQKLQATVDTGGTLRIEQLSPTRATFAWKEPKQ